MSGNDTDYIRKPAWAGAFYDDNPIRLHEIISNYLAKSPKIDISGPITGLVVPHAGYEYSGMVAAAAYNLVIGEKYDSVVIIAPSHHEYISGISIFSGKAYETPFGIVPVDTQLAHEIAESNDDIHLSIKGHSSLGDRTEHSLEVQLPFLQTIFPEDLKIVPIVYHDYSLSNCINLGNAIADSLKNRKILIIASSDLYHGQSYEDCLQTDERTLKAIEKFNAEVFCNGLKNGTFQACGGGPIASLLIASKEVGADNVKVIMSTNSSEITGRKRGWTVGYAAVVVYKNSSS